MTNRASFDVNFWLQALGRAEREALVCFVPQGVVAQMRGYDRWAFPVPHEDLAIGDLPADAEEAVLVKISGILRDVLPAPIPAPVRRVTYLLVWHGPAHEPVSEPVPGAVPLTTRGEFRTYAADSVAIKDVGYAFWSLVTIDPATRKTFVLDSKDGVHRLLEVVVPPERAEAACPSP